MAKGKAGRPSKDKEDWPALISMAEMSRCGKSRLSARMLSRVHVGLEPAPGMKPKEQSEGATEKDRCSDKEEKKRTEKKKIETEKRKKDEEEKKKLESHAKRLERKYLNCPDIEQISVYHMREQERHNALSRRGANSLGPFHERRLKERDFIDADQAATSRVARELGEPPEWVMQQADLGLKKLKEIMPTHYKKWRI